MGQTTDTVITQIITNAKEEYLQMALAHEKALKKIEAGEAQARAKHKKYTGDRIKTQEIMHASERKALKDRTMGEILLYKEMQKTEALMEKKAIRRTLNAQKEIAEIKAASAAREAAIYREGALMDKYALKMQRNPLLRATGTLTGQFVKHADPYQDKTTLMNIMSGLSPTLMAGGKMALTGGALMGIGGIAATVGPAALLMGKLGGKSSDLARMQAIGGLTQPQRDELHNIAKEMARTWGLTTDSIIGGMTELTKAGWEYADVLKMIETLTLTSAAHSVDMAQTAQILTSALNIFELDPTQSGRIMDVMTTAAMESIMDFSEFAEALQYGGFAAKMVGLEIEEFSAYIAMFSQMGQKTSIGARGMRQLLFNMVKDPDRFAEHMALGGAPVESFVDGNLNIEGMFASLSKAELSPEFWSEFLPDIGLSTRETAPFAAMAFGGDEYNRILKEIEGSQGSVFNMATIMASSLGNQLVSLGEHFMNIFETPEMMLALTNAVELLKNQFMNAKNELGPLGILLKDFVDGGVSRLLDTIPNLVRMFGSFMQRLNDLLPLMQRFGDILTSVPIEVILVFYAFDKLNKTFGVFSNLSKAVAFDTERMAFSQAKYAAILDGVKMKQDLATLATMKFQWALSLVNYAMSGLMFGSMLAMVDAGPAIVGTIVGITIAVAALAFMLNKAALGWSILTFGAATAIGYVAMTVVMDQQQKKMKADMAEFEGMMAAQNTSFTSTDSVAQWGAAKSSFPSTMEGFGDVIWRHNQPPIAISPDDDLVAVKDLGGFGGGNNGGHTTYNVYDISTEGMRAHLDTRRYRR